MLLLYEDVISGLFAAVEREVPYIGDRTWCGGSPTEVPVVKALVILTSCSRAPQILKHLLPFLGGKSQEVPCGSERRTQA